MPEWTEERPLCVVTGFGYLGDKFLREKGFKHVRFLSADGALESYPPGPTISPVYCRRDGKVDVEYYAINIVVPQKQLYKSIQQLRSIGGSGVLVTKLTYIFDEETPRWRPLRARVVTWRMLLLRLGTRRNVELEEGEEEHGSVVVAVSHWRGPSLQHALEYRQATPPHEYVDIASWPKKDPDGRITEYIGYKIPDGDIISKKYGELDQRSCDDPNPYLFIIRSHDSHSVKGTILIPSRTANKGIFPLNGTYFQRNEVFADHISSHTPIEIGLTDYESLQKAIVYFGSSIPSITKDQTQQKDKAIFKEGYICTIGFDPTKRSPHRLCAHIHATKKKSGKSTKVKKSTKGNKKLLCPKKEISKEERKKKRSQRFSKTKQAAKC